MSWEPTTYCKECGEAFDVYRAPDERICESCQEESHPMIRPDILERNLVKEVTASVTPSKTEDGFVAHTPTPWAVCYDPANDSWYAGVTISGKTGQGKTDYRVADVSVLNHAYKANAAFIVRACNAHDDLLAALRKIDHTLSVHGHVDADTELHGVVRAAISKAESKS